MDKRDCRKKRREKYIQMIEDAQEMSTTATEVSSRVPRRAFSGLRARRLSAIEIAEGALLADIGVVFQLLIRFLPIGGDFLRLLVPVAFAVLVLRRGLYVGCMSLCVALFIISIMMGPGGAPLLLLEAGAGLFLGVTMRHRLQHTTTIFLGVVFGGLALWSVLLMTSFLSGGPAFLLHGLRQSYAALVPVLGTFFRVVGLGNFWLHTLFPLLDRFFQWGLQNWLVLFYLASCALCIPVVIAVYLLTNFFLRLLGYPVRPFPGYLLEGLLDWCVRCLFKLIPRRAFTRFSWLHSLKAEVRRLNIARLRQQRLAREAKKGR